MSDPQSLTQLFALDSLLDTEEIAIRDTVRRFADEKIRPHIGDWFEAAALPVRELAEGSANSACSACTSRDTAAPA